MVDEVRTSLSGFSGFGRRGRGALRSPGELQGLVGAEEDVGRDGMEVSADGRRISSFVRVDVGLLVHSSSSSVESVGASFPLSSCSMLDGRSEASVANMRVQAWRVKETNESEFG